MPDEVRYQGPHRTTSIRLYNLVGRTLRRCGVSITPKMSVDALLAEAQALTGLSDFGDDLFREPLRRLVDAFQREARLTPMGLKRAHGSMVSTLCNRLWIERDLKAHPEILDVEIRRPLMIAGLPRTGSTLLHNLLSQDERSRHLKFWEVLCPAAPESDSAREATPTQLAKASGWIDGLYSAAPGVRDLHPVTVQGPDEDHRLFANCFYTKILEWRAHIPSYAGWLHTQDYLPAYRYFKKQVQLLMWHRPGGPLTTKCVFHAWNLDALLEVFPDACLIQIHRDPVDLLATWCSMGAMVQGVSSDDVDLHEMGSFWSGEFDLALRRMMKVRTEKNSHQFFDLPYRRLIADPVGAIREIYEYFGRPFDEKFASGIKRYLVENPNPGKHRYSLEQFGLTRRDLEKLFANYREQYILPHATQKVAS